MPARPEAQIVVTSQSYPTTFTSRGVPHARPYEERDVTTRGKPFRVGRERKHGTFASDKILDRLHSQDRILGMLEEKLNAPVLNGGFEDLIRLVDRIENAQEQFGVSQEDTNKKLGDIHTMINDPEKGLYVEVKTHSKWIDRASSGMRWFVMLLAGGALTGAGKFVYDLVTKHFHYVP